MTVLIVEDERSLSHEIEIFLTKEGYHCDAAFSGAIALQRIEENSYDFVLLDLGLPDTDGLLVLKEAKAKGCEAAFIILTARGHVDDKVKGLEMGADDYLSKPFSLSELQARMQAILRRKHGLKSNTLQIKDFVMDINNRTVHHNGNLVPLTKKEFDLMHYLALNRNRVLTRMQLIEHIWGDTMDEEYDSNFIDVHVKNLRKKLTAFTTIEWFETERGIGYRFNLPGT